MQHNRVRLEWGLQADPKPSERQIPGLVPLRTGRNFSLQLWVVLVAVSCLATLLSGCGSVIAGGLTVSPGTVSFGGVAVGQAIQSNALLTNTSTSAIHILQLSVSGESFSVDGGESLPITIPAGGSYNLQLQFTPVAAGQAAGQLTVNTDARTAASATVKLSGTGLQTLTESPAAPAAVLNGISCGNSSVTGPGTDNCTVTLSAPAGGGGFSVNLSSGNPAVTVPASVTIPGNAASAGFAAQVSAISTPQTTTITANANGVQVSTLLQLNASTSGPASAPTAALNGFSCASTSVMGPATVNCTVSLSAAAPAGGFAITVTSGNSAVAVPGTVIVPAGASSTGLVATVSSVASAETALLTASASGVSQNVTLRLSQSGPMLTVNATTVAFGNVMLNTTATQSVVLQSAGTQPVTVSLVTLTGLGFSMPGVGLPLTLAPGQSAILNIVFDPTLLGAATGALTISSDSVNGTSTVVSLSGTGASAVTYAVDLTWDAPANTSDPVAGYHIYRAAAGGTYELLNPSGSTTATAFTDAAVQSGASYTYYVASVDSSGIESVPSNTFAITIP